LESAANFYFDKNAEDLTIEESATLVGLLTSPNNYSPFKNEEKCIKRRNTVLKSMLDCNYLSENEYKKAKNAPLNTKKSIENGKYNDYINAVLDELDEMDLGNYNIAEGCKIVTGLNTDIQNLIENEQFDCDNAIIITNKNGEINAFKSTIGSSKRQIGSTIKPILVYAPAIEEKIVHPFTKIIDEKIDFNGYSPENYDKKYHGAVTVSKCLQQSYNVPSVKLLNNLTIEKAEKYAKLMGITLENEEKNLALALGGMKYGLSLQEICDSYSTFQNEGNMVKASFIKEIIGINGEIVYKRETEKRKVFSDGTSSLMNEILIGTSKTGTGKKLKNFDFDIATKTGTCGNESGNTDAYAISYTSSHIIGLWLGDKNNQRLNITGGNDCCEYTIKILTELYNDSKPTPLEKEKGTAYIEIDKEEYDKNDNIIIADEVSPMLNKMKVKCLKSNIPKEVSTRFSLPKIKKTAINVTNDSILIVLCQTEYYYYLINRVNDNEKTCIYDGKWSNEISDTPDDGYCFYEVTPYYFDGKNKYFGKTETTEKIHFIKNIGQNNLPDTDRLPDIAFKDWYNQ
jgi:membrane peptidoglycan carboxypeptidase